MTYDTAKSKYLPKGFWPIAHYGVHPDAEFPPARIALKAYGRQNHGSWEEGYDIRKYVTRPLGADVLDYLLDNPAYIPEEWKGKLVFFWGTIYGSKTQVLVPVAVPKPGEIQTGKKNMEYEMLFVRCLMCVGGRWVSDHLALHDEFGPTRLSAELPGRRSLWQWIKDIFKRT